MSASLAQKLVARAAGIDRACVGAVVTADVDLAMIHDLGRPRRVEPIPENRHGIITDHGILPHLRKRFAGAGA